MHAETERLIAELRLAPHPEGGYYRETYRSDTLLATARGERSALTTIVFLLRGATFSAFHSLASDESWHFYRGGPLAIEIIDAKGRHERRVLASDGPWQTAIAAGSHFAAHVLDPSHFALVGCDVAPGFDFDDFRIDKRATLRAGFPQHAALIERFTRS